MILHEPDWNSENAAELRAFLKTNTGKLFLENLEFDRPQFLGSAAHPHKSFARSCEINGYEQAVKTLLGLIEAEEKPLSEQLSDAYPDPDDDSKWLTPTNPE